MIKAKKRVNKKVAKKRAVRLPNTMSGLLALALKDLAKAEKSSKFVVDMNDTYALTKNGKCRVCLAGSILAFTEKKEPKYGPLDFKPAPWWTPKHEAIDRLRRGEVASAAKWLGQVTAVAYDGGLDREMPGYGQKGFKPAIRKLIADLKKHGL